MTIHATGRPPGEQEECRIRIAAAGDVHYGGAHDRDRAKAALARLAGRTDLVLLAGDLTTYGEPEQAAILAEAAPEAGIVVLDRAHHVVEVCGTQVGIAGAKGFVGGFTGSHIPDFGEPLLREVYAQGMEEVAGLDASLRAIAMCPFRIVLLHYAPTTETLEGERRDIWSFLGTDRLAVPIAEHTPDLVLHGHAHAGTFAGRIGEVPVYNVSVPVMGEDWWVFEMSGAARVPSEVR